MSYILLYIDWMSYILFELYTDILDVHVWEFVRIWNKKSEKSFYLYQFYTVAPFWIYLFWTLHACFSAILYWISSHGNKYFQVVT
jgi:hypothetical protein